MLYFFATFVSLIAMAVGSNLQRKSRRLQYELTPNCLLTRWPILFITGKRSLFYFSKYWNVYPEFLTEHGYEVYTLHLPWASPLERVEKMKQSLEENTRQGRRYHILVDSPTHEEFQSLWNQNFACIESLTPISNLFSFRSALGIWNRLSYFFHGLKVWPTSTPSPHILGVSALASLQNAQLLLQTVSQLAEGDFQKNDRSSSPPLS